MKKTRFFAISIFLLLAIIFISSAVSVADSATPVLYRNDTKYTISDFPPEVINGTLHLPVNFFVGFHNIEYQFNKENNSFYLRNEETGRFFAYSFNSSGIVVDNSFLNINFPIEHSTVYLPLEYCAEILSLKIETISDSKAKRVRVTDGHEILTFKEIIELYDPTNPSDSPIINPDNPNGPIDPSLTDKVIYITIDVYPDTQTEKILNTLRNWGEKATFFFTKEAIETDPKSVLRAFGSGNGVAITSSPEKKELLSCSLEETKKELEMTNRLLYDAIGFCSRLYRFPEGTDETAIQSPEFFPSLTEMGYIVWDYTIEADLNATSNKQEAKRIYDSTTENKITVVRLTSSEKSEKILSQLLSYVAHDEHLTARVIDSTVSEYNFFIQNSKNQED